MKTFIFSNCKKSDNETFVKNVQSQIPLEDTRLVFLNRGLTFWPNKELWSHPNIVFILHEFPVLGLSGYWGLQDIFEHEPEFPMQEVVLFRPLPGWEYAELNIGRKNITNPFSSVKVKTPWVKQYEKDNPGKGPTTGMSAFFFVQLLYGAKPEDIVLVNFYGNDDNSTPKFNSHNWDFEDKWVKQQQRIFC